MSDISRNFILLAVGLVITVGIITLFVSVNNRMTEQINNSRYEQEKEIQNMTFYPITKYDDCTIWGSDAVIYVRAIYDSLESILINDTELDTLSDIRDETSICFIDPIAKYNVEVIYNNNGVPNDVKINIKE